MNDQRKKRLYKIHEIGLSSHRDARKETHFREPFHALWIIISSSFSKDRDSLMFDGDESEESGCVKEIILIRPVFRREEDTITKQPSRRNCRERAQERRHDY